MYIDLQMYSQVCLHNFLKVIFLSSLLASGSDDQHVIVWDPFRHKKLTTMHTGHAANIFSVKVSRTSNKIFTKLVFSDLCKPALSDVSFLVHPVPSSYWGQNLDHGRSGHKSPCARPHREGNHPHVLRSH